MPGNAHPAAEYLQLSIAADRCLHGFSRKITGIQYRLPALLKAVSQKSPWIKLAFVDGGYAGDETQRAAFEASRIRVSVVKRSDRTVKGFVVLPKRWIVERTLGWLNRARRLAKDFEALIESSGAWLMVAL
jgi:transposase